MAEFTVEEQKEIPTLPADSILFVKVEGVFIKTVNEGQSNEWKKAEFKFKVLGIQHTGDGSPVNAYDNLIGEHIYGSVPARITNHPENKLRMWSEAILGMDLGLGFKLNTDDLTGRQCRAITSTYTKRTGGVRHQVESLLNMGGQTAPPMPATPAQVAAEQQQSWAQQPPADPWQQQQAQPQQQFAQQPAYPGVQTQPPAGGGWGQPQGQPQGAPQGGGWDEPGF